MPTVTVTSKRQVNLDVLTLNKLEKLCKRCYYLKRERVQKMYVFSVLGEEGKVTKQDDLMMAVAEYNNDTFAIYPAEYLDESDFHIIQYFLDFFKRIKTIIVFDQVTYNAVIKYSRGRNLSIYMN